MALKKSARSMLFVAPYLMGGFSAPFIFRHAPSPQIGGRYAGVLFILAGVYSLWLARVHHYSLRPTVLYLRAFFTLELFFWSWRFADSKPLAGVKLLGLSGSHWHGLLTTLYLVTAVVLFAAELRAPQLSRK